MEKGTSLHKKRKKLDEERDQTRCEKKHKVETVEISENEGNSWPFSTPFQRWVDHYDCGYRGCSLRKDRKVTEASAAVVVRPTDNTKATNFRVWKKMTEAQQRKCLVNWNENQVVMHAECWKKFCDQKVTPKELALRESALETAEFYDDKKKLKKSVLEAVELFRSSNYTVSFTGAGASVTAGIGTYRGTEGIDTKEELGQTKKPVDSEEEESDVDYESLQPMATHKALVTLHKNNKMHAVITQNCDNLHRKAGTPLETLYELHGNVFVEYCEKCETEYQRDYCVDLYSTNCYKEKWFVKCKRCGLGHYTGRICSDKECKGKLKDTIINCAELRSLFLTHAVGDFLSNTVLGGLSEATKECKKADLSISLGSSMTVPPACLLPMKAKQSIIVNLQKTEYDEQATVRVFYPCDGFMTLLLEKLEL